MACRTVNDGLLLLLLLRKISGAEEDTTTGDGEAEVRCVKEAMFGAKAAAEAETSARVMNRNIIFVYSQERSRSRAIERMLVAAF